MIALPFIYFTILFLHNLRRNKSFEISAFLILLYLVSSFFSILIDLNDLRSYETIDYDIGVIPTILYCFLITLSILPFYNITIDQSTSVNLKKPKLFNSIVYFYFGCFIIILLTSYANIISILNGDLGELRTALSRGETIFEGLNINSIFHPIILIADIFGGYSVIMLLFYFYSICFLKNSRLFNSMILISSLTIVIIGILGIDRSKSFYWMISYVFGFILFRNFLEKKQKIQIYKSTAIIFSFILLYFIILTVSRFGEIDSGTKGGIISYAGQSFINFCFFYDNFDFNDYSLQRVFPLFYKLFINNGIYSTTELNVYISSKTGIEVGIFSTFIGDIMIASGKIAAITFVIMFYLISKKNIRLKSKSNIYFHQLILLFCFISVPMFGIFVHFYANFPRVITFIFFLLYSFTSKYNLARKK